jgi:hypothetical protein
MTPARAKPKHLESIEQRLFVQRVRLDPRTRDLPACAIPNGGRRGPREAAILKAEGVSAGAPDWVLMAARGQFVGLALEFKGPTGRVSPAQAAWHASLRHELWAVYIVKSAQEAWDVLAEYLSGGDVMIGYLDRGKP